MYIASLVYDVSKDLYASYQKAKSRDDDIKDIRAQLLSMGEKSVLVQEVLRRDGAKAEDEASIEHNLQNCNGAVAELRGTVERLKTVTQSGQGTLATWIKSRLKSLGRRTTWPFKKETILALAGHVRTCYSALDSATFLSHLNVSISHIEKIRDLDNAIMSGNTSMDTALGQLKIALQIQLRDLSEQLAQQARLSEREQAREIVESLRFEEMANRVRQITDANDETYAWLFTAEAQGIAEVQHLVHHLNVDHGLFWI
jgi:hypothetical protein